MDAFQLLKTDHQRVSTLFEEIESASDGADKQTLFAQLHQELDLHANVEETIFYPTLVNTEAARELTLEAYQEHRVVKDLLSELASGDPSAEEWAAKLTVLKENVEHHVEEEEGELFRKARAVLSNEEIETLGDEMQAAKTANEASESATKQQPVKRAAKPDRTKARRRTGLVGALASLVGLGGEERTGNRKIQRATSAATRSSTKTGSKTTGAGSKSAKGRKQTAAKASSSKTSNKGTAAKSSKRSSTKKTSARKAAKAPARTSKRRATVSSRSSAARKVSRFGGKSAKGGKRTSGKQRRGS